jgi:D-serine deaminase-like pyridoxal phosphate-dependent protein
MMPVAIDDVPTPALLVDLDLFEANVAAMAALLDGRGATVRPHAKTHRTPELLRRQLGGRVAGVTCATVGEAEVMVAAGLDDVLLANEVVDTAKLVRLAALARSARVTLAVDDAQGVMAASRAAEAGGVTLGVLVDVDILLHRGGVATAEAAVDLARCVDSAPALQLEGIMGYEGRVRPSVEDRAALIAGAYARLRAARDALSRAGFTVRTVSAAGTSTLREALADPTITEIQAGVYALMEPELSGAGLPFRCAAVVRGTVISRHADRVVLDVGRRSVGVETGLPVPVGLVAGSIAVADEHTTIRAPEPVPALGSRVDLVPAQIRTTFNLHERVWMTRAGALVTAWPVSARGRSS